MLVRLPDVFDDRGSPVRYRDPLHFGSELNAADRVRVNGRLNKIHWRFSGLLIAISLGCGTYAMLMSSRPTVVISSTLTVTLAALSWWFDTPRFRRVLWGGQWKARYKELGRCPACQYSLASLEPATDGCTVCPECGAAWRLAK